MGSIIIGYQGVGKSTLAGKDKFIDLESGNFWYINSDGEKVRDESWYIVYCNMACHLAEQGYNVFLSSHATVRNELRERMKTLDENIRLAIVSPAVTLKEYWIAKLQHRYIITQKDKDYKALKNAEDRYTENVQELQADDKFEQIILKDTSYDLKQILQDWLQK